MTATCRHCRAEIAQRFVGTIVVWGHLVNPRNEHHYPEPLETLVDRLMRSVRIMPNGCWEWSAGRDSSGYGNFRGRGAHRVMYEQMVGPIDRTLHLDHLCENPPCVNPAHLEVVTPRENTLRGRSFAAANAQKTHCSRGHAYTEENTYRLPSRPTVRYCRTCNNKWRPTLLAREPRSKASRWSVIDRPNRTPPPRDAVRSSVLGSSSAPLPPEGATRAQSRVPHTAGVEPVTG